MDTGQEAEAMPLHASCISTLMTEIRMLRSGRILGRKTTSHMPRSTGRSKTPAFRQTTRHPTVGTRDGARSQIRTYSIVHDSKAIVDAGTAPASPPRQCSKPPLPLIKVSPVLYTTPIFRQKSPAAKPPPFDKSTQALFDNLYSKLPLDHTKYKTIVEVPGDYAVLSLENNHVLKIKCSMFDSKVLTFPLNPEDSARILTSGKALECHVQDLRKNLASRYIFSLEGVDKMRRALDPEYQPL
jgi:hypothetical protein